MKQKKIKIREDKVNNIVEQLFANKNEIYKEINREFARRDSSITQYISVYMAKYYGLRAEKIKKYEWYYDGCPYDYSGDLKLDGCLPVDITVEDFFEAYNGSWEATYSSGYGKHWNTYLDDLCFETLELGEDIMWSVLNKRIAEIDNEPLTDYERDNLHDKIHDEFYCNTKTENYFCGPCFGDDILKMTYNSFVNLSREKREATEEDEDFELNYENFYNKFYVKKS